MRRLLGSLMLVSGCATTGIYINSLRKRSEIHSFNQAELRTPEFFQRVLAQQKTIPQLEEWPELTIPSRSDQIVKLQSDIEFDILVIGGGATGCGVALDAATRGLNTAMVDKFDFSSGTSSKSTKLIHGGVRYLQKAILGLDYEQYKLVREALQERANLLRIAPHLAYPLPIMLPIYTFWQIPYFWAGIKCYDMVAGKEVLQKSYFVSRSKALEMFPMLNKQKLRGAIIYYDGQHNDARMNIALAITAAQNGATIANHVNVKSLLKNGKGKVCGAHVCDRFSKKEWDIHAKVVINATGPFTDSIRVMSESNATPICQPSAGIHVVLPSYYSPKHMGLLDPNSSDGRVIFFLPWEGKTIAGTTDSPIALTHTPQPSESSIQFILSEIRNYLDPGLTIRRGDVQAAWSGIRPLVSDPSSKNTQSISRNHVIEVDKHGLITIAGGKWTTYRSMAEEAVSRAVSEGGLQTTSSSNTLGMFLNGGEQYHPLLFVRLIQDFGLEHETAWHLARCYGDKAAEVARLASFTGKKHPLVGRKLAEDFPYIEAEVLYALKEYACTVTDVVARRLSLAFLNVQAAEVAVPRIAEIMGERLGWSWSEREAQVSEAIEYLDSMGNKVRHEIRSSFPEKFNDEELVNLKKKFLEFDKDHDGQISVLDMRKVLENLQQRVTEQELRELIAEVDTNRNQTIEFEEFVQLIASLKAGTVTDSRFGALIQQQDLRRKDYSNLSHTIPVEKSGGGV
ncbi:Glycerol-3-phosphate dehydrogenase, mitochondrial-like [Oopsacas minuta]|uniref:Glycerol-3-phosphate dehydrogenase n=1 Tax=Oopsacas minuta TaxID=111878 RepID=A0AAV7KL81_9METZ|nr:Glycerol-3-phosphate dehydrogenase, mitochondrial-like [Oopsacas minuta]